MYTQHHLLTLLLFKDFLKGDYRDSVTSIDLGDELQECLELEKIPHFTTLQKFMTRLRSLYYDMIRGQAIHLSYSRGHTDHQSRFLRSDQIVCQLLLFREKRYKERDYLKKPRYRWMPKGR